jgi:hypothetical protein
MEYVIEILNREMRRLDNENSDIAKYPMNKRDEARVEENSRKYDELREALELIDEDI